MLITRKALCFMNISFIASWELMRVCHSNNIHSITTKLKHLPLNPLCNIFILRNDEHILLHLSRAKDEPVTLVTG